MATSSISLNPSASTSTAGATSGTSDIIGLSGSDDLGTTFMSLLATELQNQDPTQPMDPTEMVGQMVELNELNQLVAIRQLLSSATTSTTTGAATESNSTAQVNN